MKKLFYFIIILIFGACSVTTEEDSTSSSGTSDGTASAPVELTVGTEKTGSVTWANDSYYKFTTASTGAGSYELGIASLVISDSYSSSSSVITYLYSDSGYSTVIEWNSCLASCTEYFYYMAFDASTTYYLRIYGYGDVTYSLTVSKGGSEGSKNNPVELALGTAHPGSVEGTSSYGKSYYKFTTSAATDNYTLTMNNSDDLDCQLYSNSGFTTVVDYYYNECTSGPNISDNFTGADASSSAAGSGLTEGTYYLKVEGESSTATTTTYNITVQAASAL